MVYIASWQKWLVGLIVAFAILFTLPNFLSADMRNALPSWLPKSTVNLGLDLQGGAYLLFDVDFAGVQKERQETMRADIRARFRDRSANILYDSIEAVGDTVVVKVKEPAQYAAAAKILRDLAQPTATLVGGSSEYTMTDDGAGTYRITPNETYQRTLQQQILSQSIEVVRKRIDELGTREPDIQAQGGTRILVQVPGESDPQRIIDIVGSTAKMTFRLVDENQVALEQALRGIVPPEDELLYEGDEKKGEATTPLLVQRRVMVAGERLTNASGGFEQQTGQWVVNFRFDTRGAKEFGDATKSNVGKRFAIVLDNKVISAPNIRTAILGGQGYIEGSFNAQSANDLAILLNAGALPAKLTPIEQRTVGAGLGKDSVDAGKYASIGGLACVVAFMVLTYGLFGFFAAVALFVNMVLLMAVLTFLQATLTLPGIAGMVLTMGMAVDANVLIYERIREELRGGKTLIAAVDAGFSRAATTIIDTNATHLLAAAIMFYVGTGPVKGFAVTLGLGVATSFFTAVMVTRIIIVTWLRTVRPKALVL